MFFKVVILCVAVAAVSGGYLGAGLRYAAPSPIGFATPAISYAAPSFARVEHLAPAVSSLHRTELYTAPIARTALGAPAVQTIAATPLIAAAPAPLIRSAYLGHGFGYGVAPASFGFARALPLGYAGAYRAGW